MKKINIPRFATVVLMATAFTLSRLPAQAQSGCCITLQQPNHTDVLIQDYIPDYLTATSVFQVTTASAVGDVPAGTYAAWCIDSGTELDPAWATVWSGSLISTCDPNELPLIPNHGGTPPVGPPPFVTQTTWNEVNYILNNRGATFYWDVQAAINSLVGGPPIANNPAYSAIPYHPAVVAALVAAAQANPNYQVPCGGVVGIIFNSDDLIVPGGSAPQHVQLLVMEVPCICVLGHGDTATIGFWHNKNGQALILSFNGGGASTKLGDWLAGNFPCLFGNLAGKKNSVVAAQFLTYFNVTGQKTYAQVMASALACYATSSTLAGGSMAGKYGFNVSPTGTGAKTYNVGSYGSALGLANNTSYTVFQLLQAANAKCPFGTSGTVFNALNSIFDGINTTGDIQ